MQAKIKKTIAGLLVMFLMIMSIPLTAFADTSGGGGVGDKDNSGSGQGGGAVNSAYTWDTNQSGYRLTIIDENYEPVSKSIDIVFSAPSQVKNPNDYYTNSRAESLSNKHNNYDIRTIDQIYKSDEFKGAKYPPVPIKFITVNGTTASQAQGEAFKKWFLSGEGSISRPVSSVSSGGSNTGSSGNSGGSSSGSTGGSSSGSSSSNNWFDDGTTKPIKTETRPIQDMTSVSKFLLMSSSVYRADKRMEAVAKVIEQGYYEHAKSVIKVSVSSIKNTIAFRTMKELKTIEEIREDVIRGYWETFGSIGKSYAEAVYMFTATIDEAFGTSWKLDSFSSMSSNDTMKVSVDNMVIASNELLEQIPLAGDSNEEGYALKLLNSISENKFLFDIPGTDISDPNKYVTSVMIKNNYSIIVEPIFWFVPAASGSSGLPTSPIHSNYVYGTVGNFIEFSENHGYKYGASGGAYSTLLGSLGWRSMYLGEDWLGNGVTIKGYSELIGKKSLSELNSMLNSKQGIAMHIYITDVSDSSQTTRDFSKGDTPHEAPDPSSLAEPTGDSKKYKIVKYYEQELSEGTVDRQKFVTAANPPLIKINDEISYKVKDWFITTSDSNGQAEYQASKSMLSSTRSGTKAENVKLGSGELTVHLLLVKKPTVISSTGLNLGESEISKAITTMDTGIDNWGPRTFAFNYASMAGSDTHYCGGCKTDSDGNSYCPGHSCTARFGDSAFKYIIENSAAIDNLLEANGAGGVFAAKMVNNMKYGSANLGGGTNRIEDAEYQTVIWRGLDIPTIASYKEDGSIPLKGLLNRYGKTPAGDRSSNGVYQRNLTIQLNVASDSDVNTHSVHSYTGETFKSAQHSYNNVGSHFGEVNIHVYRGTNSKAIGNETKANEIQTITPFGNVTSLNSAGYMIQETTPIQFYPYVRMTYQTTGSNVKHDVNVLSQFYSEMIPNSFGEAAWITGSDNENENLVMSSTQWSLHSKGVNGDKPWNGPNKILPGGALYTLGTGGTSATKVALVTWQPIVEPDVRNMLYNNLQSNEYSVNKANAEHKMFVDQGKLVLENLRIVQWVNADANATNVWSGQAVKITGGGESLAPLSLSGTTSSEAKYHLKGDSVADAANEGDLDIIKTTDSNDVYFKVFADTSGNVYLAKSIGAIDPLRNVNGTNLNAPASVTVTKVLSKNDTVADIYNKLTGDARELDQRTLAITNTVKCLERGKGNHIASWALDGKWYSEAFDGLVVVRKSTVFDIGFLKPSIRTSVLDPRICPPSSGQSDMFSRFFSSRFMVDSKSTASIAQDKPNHWIGTFKNKDIYLPSMERLYMSKVFYVPNVNVQDLH